MSFENQLLQFMAATGYRPMKQHELALSLKVDSTDNRAAFRQALYALEKSGQVVRLRKNRWALPETNNQLTGTIRMMANGGAIFIPDQEGEAEIYINEKNKGTAFPNDKVAIEVFHSEFAAHRRENRGQRELRAEGRVIKVVERVRRRTVGLLRQTPYYSYIIPDDPGFRQDVRVKNPNRIPEHHKVVVELDEWIDPYKPLTGTIIETLGAADAPGVDVDSLLSAAGITEAFPPEVIREAEAISNEITPERMQGRRDLRAATIFTIDPETARDYDDAISLEPHPKGGWQLGIHIADVSTYVQPGSRIDKEAYRRGNSIYLVDRAIMMLPTELTTKVCSLNPENDHLTHSVEIHLSPAGKVLSYESFPSIIQSQARLTYTQVQHFIDGLSDHGISETVVQKLKNLCPLIRTIREKRIANGSVDINTPEIEIKLNDQGKIIKIMPRSESKEAYQVVEECMLLANCAVAELLIKSERPAIYRVHDEPDEEQWAAMGMELQVLGIPKLPQTRQEINEAIRLAIGTPVEYTASLAILRNFKRAEYSSTQIGHFGLAFDDYTHFTSPIRRYADLLVHRMLKAVETGHKSPWTMDQIEAIAKHCNETERQADELERKSIETKRIEYYREILETSPTATFKGYIVAIKGKGMIVELPDTLLRGMVLYSSITGDWLEANEAMTQVQTRGGKVRYTLGDEMEVVLAKVDTERGFIDFILANQVVDQPRRPRRHRVQPDLKTGKPRQKGRRKKRR